MTAVRDEIGTGSARWTWVQWETTARVQVYELAEQVQISAWKWELGWELEVIRAWVLCTTW